MHVDQGTLGSAVPFVRVSGNVFISSFELANGLPRMLGFIGYYELNDNPSADQKFPTLTNFRQGAAQDTKQNKLVIPTFRQ